MTESDATWAQRALRACLDALPESITEGASLEVVDSWAEPPAAICVVYRCPWFEGTVGLRVSKVGPDMWGGTPEDPEGFGGMVADFELGDPWYGGANPPLVEDADGVHWWGNIEDGPPVRPGR
jgi:hypothetical protein